MEFKFVLLLLAIASLTSALPPKKPKTKALKKAKSGGKCSLTFQVDANEIQGLCQSPQAPQGIAMQEMQTIRAENVKLRQDLEAMKAEYESMVETVKTLKTETATWREIIEWPMMDAVFKPDNETMYIAPDGPTYKGMEWPFSYPGGGGGFQGGGTFVHFPKNIYLSTFNY